MTMMVNASPSTNLTTSLPRPISAYLMAKIRAWRRRLSANRAKQELNALGGRGLADIGMTAFEVDDISIYTASAETRDHVMHAAGWSYK